MATLTIGTASGGYYNFRGVNSPPYAVGSDVVIATTGGDINIASTLEGIVVTQLTFQVAANSGTSTYYGNIWNSSGTSITNSAGVAAAADTAAPFSAKTFNLSDQYFPRSTVYAGFSRAAADDANWDVVNGNNSTRIGNTAGSAPSGLTGTGTGTVYRRLVGTLTYTAYDAGNISQSVTQTADKTARVTYAGTAGTYGKNVVIDWGDGSTDTSFTVAAGATPALQSHTYATAGTRTITTTISYANTAVGLPNITLTTSFTTTTVPGTPTGLTVTPGTAATSVTQAVASWTAPASNPAITSYEYSFDGSTWTTTGSTGATYTATGLSKYTSYTIYIRARNTWGAGGSTSATFTTFGGRYAVYNGSDWVDKYVVGIYGGGTPVSTPVLTFDGTTWVYTNR